MKFIYAVFLALTAFFGTACLAHDNGYRPYGGVYHYAPAPIYRPSPYMPYSYPYPGPQYGALSVPFTIRGVPGAVTIPIGPGTLVGPNYMYDPCLALWDYRERAVCENARRDAIRRAEYQRLENARRLGYSSVPYP